MKSNLLLGTIFLILISFGISSCSSNSTAGGQVNPNATTVTKDLDNFFTIKFNNRTLTSYGATVNPTNQKLPVCYLSPSTTNYSGVTTTGIYINCEGSVLNSTLYNVYPYYWNYYQPIDVIIFGSLSHLGSDITGTYIGDGIVQSDYILDLENGGRTYYIENSSSFVLNITSAVNDVFNGNFTGFLTDGQNRIPMNGSFRAKRL